MLEASDQPSVFGVSLGVDFPAALVTGLREIYKDSPPEELAKVHLIVNTRRMARRVRSLFDEGPPCLLPRILLLTDIGEAQALSGVPQSVSPLRRRLEMVQLVNGLLSLRPDLAPKSSLYDLADSLANLMDEMHGEGVKTSDLESIDISDQSGHWQRIKTFLQIMKPYFEDGSGDPDTETRQRLVIEYLANHWKESPPEHPIIIAGSTGSRGATKLLMRTVAELPRGAIILPGFDFEQPNHVWDALSEETSPEDHPQQRLAGFVKLCGIHPSDVKSWPGAGVYNSSRVKLISLALRPAPFTDEWLRDGPSLKEDISHATKELTWLEAPSSRSEALAIAMRLRQCVEEGQTAALITPDRMLTRQVTATLDRWNIQPDDSAGIPLHQSAPGRFLRHFAQLFSEPLSTALLFTILKHPLTHAGNNRGLHLRFTRELELHLRRKGTPFPDIPTILAWAGSIKELEVDVWCQWVFKCFLDKNSTTEKLVSDHLKSHLKLANQASAGSTPGSEPTLWTGDAGEQVHKSLSDFADHADACGALGANDYASLFQSVLSRESVRNAATSHTDILIWGTLEARVQGAELLILAGLNEGSWPETPAYDPWLNRAIRKNVGLLLPERRIGLSAHDFQQAFCAKTVWLTRSIRSDDAQTVPSRWLNRLKNLLCGLPEQGGDARFNEMIERGNAWLSMAESLDMPEVAEPAKRPSPCPPIASRPKQLSVTDVTRLIRDPYAVYARHVLRLRPLDPLMKEPDPLLRGTVIHLIFEAFIKETKHNPDSLTTENLLRISRAVLDEHVTWAATRTVWFARIERIADWFIKTELARRQLAHPVGLEIKGHADISQLGFTLVAKADRIDRDDNGAIHLYDYKTGTPPTKSEQQFFEKQLLLEAAIAERAGFSDQGAAPVVKAVYIGLGSSPAEVPAPLDLEPPSETWTKLTSLIEQYLSKDQGYTSRRAMKTSDQSGDYDQLARFGEWDHTSSAEPENLS